MGYLHTTSLLWVMLSFLVVTDSSANLKLKPSISISESYSDNADLEVESEADSALITEISPSLVLSGAGAQFSYDVNYSPAFYHYRSERSSSSVQHVLSSNFNSAIVGHSVTLDGGAMISGYLSDTGKGLIEGETSTREDRSELRRVFIKPSLSAKLSKALYLVSSYEANRVSSSSDTFSDSSGRIFSFGLNNGSATVSWGINYKGEHVNTDDNTNVKASDALITLRYASTDRLQFSVVAGHEKNSGSDYINLDDGYWGWGVEWDPSTAFFGAVGCRMKIYGKECLLNVEYTGKSLFSGVKLSELLVFGRDQGSTDNVTDCVDDDESCQLKENTTSIASLPLSDGIFENQIVQLYGGLNYRKITLNGQVSKTERDYLKLGLVERLYDGMLGIVFKYTDQSQFKSNFARQHSSTARGVVDSDMLSFSYLFQRASNLGFSTTVQARKNSSSVDAENYRENRVSISAHFTF